MSKVTLFPNNTDNFDSDDEEEDDPVEPASHDDFSNKEYTPADSSNQRDLPPSSQMNFSDTPQLSQQVKEQDQRPKQKLTQE